MEASVKVPHHQLAGFKRITLNPDEKRTITFLLKGRQMALITEEGKCHLEPGTFRVSIGGCQPDNRSKMLMGDVTVEDTFKVTGKTKELEY